MNLKEKIVVVAGAGSSAPGWSIGKATCVTLARKGATVIALDSSMSAAQDTAEQVHEAGGQALAVQADITDPRAMDAAITTTLSAFGRIDTYIANVGIGKMGGVESTSPQDLERIHKINIESLLTASQRVLPLLKQTRGALVTVSSVAGLRYIGYPHLAYSITKAALIQFTRMIAHEYAASGVRANTVIPGLIDTPRIQANVAKAFSASGDPDTVRRKRDMQVPLQRMGTPWEVANAIAFLASDEASYITGTELVVDGGLTGKY